MPQPDLTRFLDAHDDFDRALAEISTGRKRTHWMWYVFPQIAGLGRSPTAQHYAIDSLDEAVAFLTHPVLGTDYIRMVDEVWHQVVQQGVTVRGLFGSPDDAKLVSSLTLFAGIARRLDDHESTLATFESRVADILDAAAAEGLDPCAATSAFLRRPPG